MFRKFSSSGHANSGTFFWWLFLQQWNAIKGNGGTVKYVSLPYEAHGYRGRENILHMLNEQFNWLEKYVKNAEKKEEKKAF